MEDPEDGEEGGELVQGLPSIKLQADISLAEESRINKQEELGESGPKEKDLSMARNEPPSPEELLTSVPSPSSGSILFHINGDDKDWG